MKQNNADGVTEPILNCTCTCAGDDALRNGVSDPKGSKGLWGDREFCLVDTLPRGCYTRAELVKSSGQGIPLTRVNQIGG